MSEADQIVQRSRADGFDVQVLTGNGNVFMFATRDGAETCVRGGDYHRVVKAIAVLLGYASVDITAVQRQADIADDHSVNSAGLN